MKKVISFLLIFSLVFSSGCTINNIDNTYNKDSKISIKTDNSLPMLKPEGMTKDLAIIPYDMNIYNELDGSYQASFVINQTTKETISCYNPHQRIYPASMTKLMTAILIADEIDAGRLSLDETIVISHDITFDVAGASTCELKAGDTLTVRTLLSALLVRSFNDCCVAMAERIAGSEEAFCQLMNYKAKELGATNTNFVNSHGLHNDNHYTTPYDLYLIFQEFERHSDLFGEIDGYSNYTMTYTSGGLPVTKELQPTNRFLIGDFSLPEGYTVSGWKTGTTSQAGYCMIMKVIAPDNTEYIILMANCQDSDTLYNILQNTIFNLAGQ